MIGKVIFSIIIVLVTTFCFARWLDPDRFLAQAREHWREKEYLTAASCYESFLQARPIGLSSLQARLELANTYYLNLKDYSRAQAHYRLILTNADKDVQAAETALKAQRRLADLAIKNGHLVEAIDEYEQLSLRVQAREKREVRLQIANLYYDRNDFAQAELEYLKVVEQATYDNLSEEAYLRIASIRHRMQHKYEAAVSIYTLLCSNTVKPSVMRPAYYGLAECYAADSKYILAIQVLKQIPRIFNLTEEEQIILRSQIKEYKKREKNLARVPRMDWSNPHKLIKPPTHAG